MLINSSLFKIFANIVLICYVTPYMDGIEMLRKIRVQIERPATELWSYNKYYPSIKSMFLTEEVIEESVTNHGKLSEEAIKKQFLKALTGQDVNLYIFGESVSVGADLGENNIENIYHYALADLVE